MSVSPDRIPVIIGVGQVNDRPPSPELGLDSLGLMEAALRKADEDAGGGWLARLDSLAVVDQISMPQLGKLTEPLAERLGAAPKLLHQTPYASGDSPILLLNEAANRIANGEIRVAAIVGGEALRTAAQRAAAETATKPHEQSAIRAASQRPQGEKPYHQRMGLVAPTDVYPLYENAGRAAYGQSLDEAQRESAQIWSLFSRVAAANDGAWIKREVEPDEIMTVSADNRPIAYPYTKLMVANSSVNQGAGFIVTSLAEAQARSIPNDRIVYVGQGAAAHEAYSPLKRDRYDASPSMAVSLNRALDLNHMSVDQIDQVELYSCFPCVPKMARRILGLPADRPATVFGGLTFGGGPIGNYMSHAVVSMVERLRAGHGRNGLLFANGGFATHNHTIVVSRDPVRGDDPAQDFDFQAEADAARGPIPPLVEDYLGSATVETFTILYKRDASPKVGIVVARTPDGSRTLAQVPAGDEAGIAALTDSAREPVGRPGQIVAGEGGQQLWQFA